MNHPEDNDNATALSFLLTFIAGLVILALVAR